jgi:hypothetical protein
MKITSIFIMIFLFIVSGCYNSDSKKIYILDSNKNQAKDSLLIKKKTDYRKYAVSVYSTPVLNTKNFDSVYGGADSKTLKRSKNGLIKELEYVAFPSSVFEIIEEYKKKEYSILKVTTKEYNIPELNIELFIDSRFVEIKDEKPAERKVDLPSVANIYKYFDKTIGTLYVWGANNITGVEMMLKFYTPKGKLSSKEEKEWSMKGLDCSGLLYEATNGFTPRNTHQLVYYGEPVFIEGLNTKEIMQRIEPLDIIVWKGHIIIVYDKNTTIESSFRAGCVVKKNLLDVLTELINQRKPVDKWTNDKKKDFVIRRWVNLLKN